MHKGIVKQMHSVETPQYGRPPVEYVVLKFHA